MPSPLSTGVFTHHRNPETARPILYTACGRGETYSVLNEGICDTSLASQSAVNTPLLLFLDAASLSNAACVCKLWWAELYTPAKLRELFGIQEIRNPAGHRISVRRPRYSLNARQRRVVWRMALLGEYDGAHPHTYSYVAASLQSTQSTPRCERPISRDYRSCQNTPRFEKGVTHYYPNRFAAVIRRDVDRTFISRPLRRHNSSSMWSYGQESLWKILTYVSITFDFGYCQGMNYAASMFLETFKGDDWLSARCFASLLSRDDIGPMFHPSLTLARAYCLYLDHLVQRYLPRMAAHFAKFNLTAVVYALSWVMTLLAYDLPISSLQLVWDQVIFYGPRIIFQVILGVMRREEETILDTQLNFEACLSTIKSLMRKCTRLRVIDLVQFIELFDLPHDVVGAAMRTLRTNSLLSYDSGTIILKESVPHTMEELMANQTPHTSPRKLHYGVRDQLLEDTPRAPVLPILPLPHFVSRFFSVCTSATQEKHEYRA